ncbi:MAG: AarF/UbiB family protein, partial [Chloroflexi bacterium]|nr:AarF/UbiB family protein [Chloroflexota bacterium]
MSAQAIDHGRYRQILRFFAGVVAHLVWWDVLVVRLPLARGWVRRSRPARLRRISRRFRELAVRMGGVLIKLGQFLSARVDVLPPEITEELAGLQDEVPPVPPEQIQAVLAAEFDDVTTHFADFERTPLAAASLGQAHCARLWPERETGHRRGPAVVVKVQRPNIEHIVRTDLAALRVVARWAMRYPPIRRRANVPALMDEFAATLWEELDYEAEAQNAVRFAQMFAGDRGIKVPAVYRQHSTGRVLVLEDVGGIKITDVEAMAGAGVDRKQVATRLMDAYFRQIFKEGFFHADPHPGNLFVLPDGTGGDGGRPFRLAFVDFGMVGHVETLMGENLRQMLVSITQRDARGLTEAYNNLGFFLPGADLERIAEAQGRLLDQLWGRNLLELTQPDPREVQEMGREFRDILYEFPFQVPQDFIYLGRTLGMLSGLSTLLDPTMNPWRQIERYGREIIGQQETRDFSWELLLEWLRPLVALPAQAQRVLAAAEAGKLRVQTTPDRALLR